jgi:chaperonin GroEL
MSVAQASVIARPQALALLARGVETLSAPLALTLGPSKGFVINERTRREIELLTDSYTIARRVIRLPGRGSNLGAMMLRSMAVELHNTYGDGVATATVLARAMLREAMHLLAAGANPALLVRGMRLALAAANAALESQARPLAGEDELVALATSVTGDAQLGALLGQMFDVMGEHATVITQDVPKVCLDHDYIKGGKWDGYIPARQLLPEGEVSLVLHHPLIVMADEDLTSVAQVQPLLELALAEPEKAPLLILARSISGDALTMLTANHVRGVLSIGMFVLSSGVTQIPVDLEDMAALTGGQLLSPITGTGLHAIQPQHFGRARQAVLSANSVTIASGAGTPSVVQRRIAGVRAELKRVSRSSDSIWELLRVRLARLTGGIGVLKLGTQTERELEIKKEQVSKALRVLELAYDGGLVPGGGVAFLACLPALESARAACRHEDETYGVAILAAALQAPFLQIVSNHGEVHPPLALDIVQRLGQGYGFDVLRGDYARMDERHILDCLRVTCGVLGAATSLATMLITTDTLVFAP